MFCELQFVSSSFLLVENYTMLIGENQMPSNFLASGSNTPWVEMASSVTHLEVTLEEG